MNIYFKLNTNGDPIAAIRRFCKELWEDQNFDEVLFPTNSGGEARYLLKFHSDKDQLNKFNPFKPLMRINAAGIIPDHINQFPEKRYAAILRPCEVRVLKNIEKIKPTSTGSITLISIDCLRTFSPDEYHWQLKRKTAHTPVQFARQGSVLAYRYRNVCQTCPSPQAKDADIKIHIYGLPVRESLLISVSNETRKQNIQIDHLTDGGANERLILSHQKVINKITQTNHRTWQRYVQRMSNLLPDNVEQIYSQIKNCPNCQEALFNCPVCHLLNLKADAVTNISMDNILLWMNACAGCGICEQVCSEHAPLNASFRKVRSRNDQNYCSDTYPLINHDAHLI